jgi:hypothetical protein
VFQTLLRIPHGPLSHENKRKIISEERVVKVMAWAEKGKKFVRLHHFSSLAAFTHKIKNNRNK